jgi:hypothetical protein
MLNFKHLQQHKKSDVAVFLGSGSSINEISQEEWDCIKQCDIWTVNNWIYHPDIVPDFYHIEVKHYNYKLMQMRLAEKWEQYMNVNFIFPEGKTIKIPAIGKLPLRGVALGFEHIYEYKLIVRDRKRTHKPFNAKYEPNHVCLTKSYDMSVTAVFELMWKLGYQRIITFGIDLMNSYYFWTGGDPIYGKVHHQTNKAHENKPPEDPHATYPIKDFLIDFNKRWFRKQDREGIFVGHTSTALYPELPLINLEDL